MRYTDKQVTIDGDTKVITVHDPKLTRVELYGLCAKVWLQETHFSKLHFPFSEDNHKWELDAKGKEAIKLGYFNGN